MKFFKNLCKKGNKNNSQIETPKFVSQNILQNLFLNESYKNDSQIKPKKIAPKCYTKK